MSEIIFIATLSSAFGIIWWAYSFIYSIISPFLNVIALSGLIEGFWFLAGPFFAYIIRKPGSALLGETIAATVEGLISQWGISAIASGICQGIPVELVFFCFRYKVWNKISMGIAGSMSAAGGYIITYFWYNYSNLNAYYNFVSLSASIVSGYILGGILAKYIADKLALSGVLNQFRICHDK